MRKRGTSRRSVFVRHSCIKMAEDIVKLFVFLTATSFWFLESIRCSQFKGKPICGWRHTFPAYAGTKFILLGDSRLPSILIL